MRLDSSTDGSNCLTITQARGLTDGQGLPNLRVRLERYRLVAHVPYS